MGGPLRRSGWTRDETRTETTPQPGGHSRSNINTKGRTPTATGASTHNCPSEPTTVPPDRATTCTTLTRRPSDSCGASTGAVTRRGRGRGGVRCKRSKVPPSSSIASCLSRGHHCSGPSPLESACLPRRSDCAAHDVGSASTSRGRTRLLVGAAWKLRTAAQQLTLSTLCDLTLECEI